MGRRYDIDWRPIEDDYRVGQLSVRMLSTKYGVAPSSITRRAKSRGWSRGDLRRFVRELTRAKLRNDIAEESRIFERYHAYIAVAPMRE
jgi:hypothetical protein